MANKQVYMGSSEAAAALGLTARRVVGLCHEGKLNGAMKEGRNWVIPEQTVCAYAKTIGAADALLPCAVGNTSFIEMSSECYYVDKTLLIKDLIDDHNAVTLFARPRRFGKTLAIDMLKTFFEKTKEDNSKYFVNKKIWECGQKYQLQQGLYPVIMLTFKDIKFDNWKDSLEAIQLVVKDEYNRHPELLSGDALNAGDKDYILRMGKGLLTDVEYSRSLLNLTRMLAEYHKQKVVILIDEYDTPIQQGYAKGFYQEAIGFMRNFLSGGLKDNSNLAFGVLTGIMRISKENLFSGLNNLTVNTVLDNRYSEYFGFTAEEVREMADYYGKRKSIKEIQAWYDGYRFGSSDIYNPWSVTSYFANKGGAKPFWANTSDNEIICEILQGLTPAVSDELIKVMQGEEIHTALNMDVVYPRLADSADTIFSFLLLAGYLTLATEPEETEFGTFATLKIPNSEIRRVYNTEILGWMKAKTAGNVISDIEKAMFLGDANRLQNALRDYMLSCISVFDGATEGFYHGMMLGLVAGLSSKYLIRSNRESGEGRFDLMLEPRDRQLPGIIMEFKAIPSADKDKLTATAKEAIAQIEMRHYAAELEERGVKTIIKYGISFSGKSAVVKMR